MINNAYFYGGAFNPMTLSHLNIIKNILSEMNNDDLLLIGITDHNYKKIEYSYELREKILTKNLLTYCNFPEKRIKLIKQDKRTWEFLNSLWYKKYTLVIGQDEYEDLINKKWHYSDEILNTFKLKVIPRTDGISSTKVRELLKNKNFQIIKNYISEETYKLLI